MHREHWKTYPIFGESPIPYMGKVMYPRKCGKCGLPWLIPEENL